MRSHHPTRTSFIPKGAVKITPKGVNAEIYISESAGKFYAVAFYGKAQKPTFNYAFRTSQRREQYVGECVEGWRKTQAWKDAQKAKRAGFRHSYKVGDVLHYSWGYEQTNCEFYQVTATTPGTITMREIGQRTAPGSEISHGMADSRLALKDHFLKDAPEITKRVRYSESGPGYISMDHGCCSLWDGRPKYCSWYA